MPPNSGHSALWLHQSHSLGRDASAQTDALMHAEILSYSRARGLFAGVALTGATLRSDDKDNEYLYGKSVENRDIVMGHAVSMPAAASKLHAELNRYAGPNASMNNKTERSRSK